MEGNYKRPRHRGHFVGSATVVGASYGHGTTSLELQTFTGEYIEYSIEAVPDSAGAGELRGKNFRPLSVKIQHGGERCSVIELTPGGARPTTVTLGTALALLLLRSPHGGRRGHAGRSVLSQTGTGQEAPRSACGSFDTDAVVKTR